MSNVGPVNGSHQVKSGKEFVNEIFLSDDEDAEAEEIFMNATSDASDMIKHDESNHSNHEHSADNKSENKKSVKFPKETYQFKDESHNIILNLSKYTLRNIVMVICDEAVIEFFYINFCLKYKIYIFFKGFSS